MTRKNKQHFLLLTMLSVGHLLFSTTSYPFLFAYFNSHDYAALFATAMAVLRVLFLLWIALWGYSSLKEHPPSS